MTTHVSINPNSATPMYDALNPSTSQNNYNSNGGLQNLLQMQIFNTRGVQSSCITFIF